VALIGEPSTKKSPLLLEVTKPLKKINKVLLETYDDKLAIYNALPKDKKSTATPPPKLRAVLTNTTVEAAQEVLRDSPDGVLLSLDELSAWFGSMEKYSSARGANSDRGFWLETFNGGDYGAPSGLAAEPLWFQICPCRSSAAYNRIQFGNLQKIRRTMA
jgi:hypothetical protein